MDWRLNKMANEELLNYLDELGIETQDDFDNYVASQVELELAEREERPSICTFCGGNLVERNLESEFGRTVKMRICEECSAIVEWYDQTVG
jgi:hypothetical protein